MTTGELLIVAHRGNLDGPNPQRENTRTYLEEALAAGFNVEADVWLHDGRFWLGHDRGKEEEVAGPFLSKPGVWVHCKNVAALEPLLDAGVHCFFHDKDEAALTSLGWVWCLVGKPVKGSRSVCLLPEQGGWADCGAVCTDYCVSPQAWRA